MTQAQMQERARERLDCLYIEYLRAGDRVVVFEFAKEGERMTELIYSNGMEIASVRNSNWFPELRNYPAWCTDAKRTARQREHCLYINMGEDIEDAKKTLTLILEEEKGILIFLYN